jgi:hypothetical protein
VGDRPGNRTRDPPGPATRADPRRGRQRQREISTGALLDQDGDRRDRADRPDAALAQLGTTEISRAARADHAGPGDRARRGTVATVSFRRHLGFCADYTGQ